MKNKIYSLLLVLLISVLYTGCSGDPEDVDTVPPEVILQSPARGATDIAVNVSVTAAFDKRVTGINGSSSSFTIQKVGSFGTLPANVSYNDTTMTATLDPVNNLEPDSVYVVTVTDEVKSRTGIQIEPVSWTFITGVAVDETAPAISSITPAADARYVPSDTAVEVIFDEPLQDTSVNTNNFILKKGTVTVPSTVTYNGVKAVLTPVTQLEDWTEYSVRLTDEIRDIAGNSLSETIWSFKTDDTTPPWPMVNSPEMDAVVPVNTVVTVQFNESVKSYTIHNTTTSFVLRKDSTGTQIPASVVYNDTTRTATLTPVAPLEELTQYRIYLTDAIKDNAHNALVPISWHFTTSGIVDVVQPQILSRNPGINNTGISRSTAVTVQFDEKVTGVDTSSFTLKTAGGVSVDAVVTYNSATRFATLTPVMTLAEGTEYTVELSGSIEDIAGNSLAATGWNFTTQDITKPVIVSRTPGAIGNIGVNSTVSVVFSEPLLASSLTSSSFKLDINATPVSGQVSYDSFTRTATFIPDSNLQYSTSYTVTLNNEIRDLFNNSLNTVSWDFVTGEEPDLTPPAISSHYPATGAAMISRNADFTVTFSEAVTGVSASNVVLYLGVNPVSSQIYYDALTRTATIRPDATLQYNTVYRIKVFGGSGTAIRDSAGNYLAASEEWTFTTVTDTTPPTVISKTPETGVPDIPGNAVNVEAVFSEHVTGVNSSTMKLIRVSGSVEIPCSVSYYSDFNTNTYRAVLTPSAPVTVTGEYIVQLTNGIRDSVNNQLIPPSDWVFSIIPVDETAPTILSRSPETGNTWLNNKVQIVFSEDVKGITSSSFYVTGPSGTIPAVVTYSRGLLTAILESEENLAYNTIYTAHLTSAVTDRANNPITGTSITWSFTTDVDTTPPWVTAKSPVNGTNGFPVNAAITATLSESVTGYNGSSFYLTPSASASITYDAASKTLTLTPVSNLAGNTTYTVTMNGGIKDLATPAGNSLGNTTWQFTTQTVSDSTSPVISGITPYDGATNISQTADIQIVFSENVINASGKISLKRQGAETVSANVSYNPSNFTATINPNDELLEDTVYEITVIGGTTGIKDASGNYLSATSTTTFTTSPDTIKPVLANRYPESGTTGIPLKPTVTVVFSEPVSNVNSSSFRISGTGVTSWYVIYDSATNTATLTPNSNLNNNTAYTIDLSSGIADRAGNTLTPVTWSFTTNSLPVVNSTVPAEGAANVSVTTSSVTINFNREMNPEKTWAELADNTSYSPAVLGDITWSPDFRTASIQIIGQLKASTAHRVKLYGWGGTFEDPEGNTLSKTSYLIDGIINFTTGADSVSPTKAFTIPKNGRVNVGRDIVKIAVGFSEQMTATAGGITLNPGNITLTNRAFTQGNRVVLFDVPSQLAASTLYTATMTGFTDAAGNALSGTTFSFTTSGSTGSQIFMTEGFDSYSAPNFDYYKNLSSDIFDWQRDSAPKFPTIAPATGSYSGKAVDNMISYPGDYSEIELRSTVDMSVPRSYMLTFQMAHESIYNRNDRIAMYVSIDGGAHYDPLYAGALQQSVFRYDYSYGNTVPLWKTHYVDLSDYAGYPAVKVKLRGYSAGDTGNNIYVDDIRIIGY